ncbi:hypothetical protein D3C76_1252760 [compost metagenome]
MSDWIIRRRPSIFLSISNPRLLSESGEGHTDKHTVDFGSVRSNQAILHLSPSVPLKLASPQIVAVSILHVPNVWNLEKPVD